MSGITTEGFTKTPVYPTCAVVTYTDSSLNTDSTASVGWITDVNALTPSNTLDASHLNTYPPKIEPDNANGWVTIQPGTYEFTIEFLTRETAAAAAEAGIALWNGGSVATASNIFFNYDGAGVSHITASSNFCGSHSGILSVDEPTDLRLVFVQRKAAAGTLTPYRLKLLLQRICGYTED